MRMTVLASGSKGNSTVIASREQHPPAWSTPVALSCRELLKRMATRQ